MPGPSDAQDPQKPAAGPARARRATVVLFRQPGTDVPPDLYEALRRNQTEPIEVDHALSAMAHLCAARTPVLLLCEPRKLAGVSELLTAVERYIPRVTRWEYMPGENPPLRPIGVSAGGRRPVSTVSTISSSSPSSPASGSQTPRAGDAFALRLTGDPGESRAGGSVRTSDLLSRDEMEALFSEDSP